MSKPKPRAPESARSRHAAQARSAESADNRLDEALEESFPASDPIAVDITDPHRAPPDKKKPD